ncbi:NTP transferase domain-containing protein [Candidatus Woesebacteria bacterium]|nr:NTP transferase domain-containing protein [Candidatus Woesebacteria bacterium]
MKNYTTGIILAGGKGTRLKSTDKNKTTLALRGKPLVQYGIDLYRAVTTDIVVVIGAFADSVKATLAGQDVLYATQSEQLGTGHATMVGVEKLIAEHRNPEYVFVGYGDHMMFYTPEMLVTMVAEIESKKAVMCLVVMEYEDPNSLAWGRIIRSSNGDVDDVIEQKDASEEILKLKELNAGFYCFRFNFLKEAITKLKPSPVTGEYYLTDLVKIARQENQRVLSTLIPFEKVGTGINTAEQLQTTESMM